MLQMMEGPTIQIKPSYCTHKDIWAYSTAHHAKAAAERTQQKAGPPIIGSAHPGPWDPKLRLSMEVV